ncbi:endonuclease domain-containing protein [Streptomyces camponoticapitis]|nr:endonuclease domain-containing protein [Streptomyces camponoticapitis]
MKPVVRDDTCGKPTKSGGLCTRTLHYWEARSFEFDRADGCWHHMSQPFKEASKARKQAEEKAWLSYLYADPICWGWPVPGLPAPAEIPESRAGELLLLWQDGRCAICGHRRESVEDHDHVTGLTRGYLCRGCNIQEGVYRDSGTLFGKYRERHPTRILGFEIRYWDPFTREYAAPADERAAEDPWTDAASDDIGL